MRWTTVWRNEWRLLLADRAPWVLAVLFTAVALYGAWNGRQWSSFQRAAIADIRRADSERLSKLEALLQRAEGDSTVSVPPAGALGASGATTHAILDVPPLGGLAVAASDLHPYYARVSVRSKASFMATDEVENPHNLLAGRFDLVFVVVWVLPLLLIALTYNTITGERDQGTMALWRAQPVPASRVLLAKLGVRAGFVLGVACLLLGLMAWLVGVPLGDPAVLLRLLLWLGVVLLYAAFWLGVIMLVNATARSSAASAVLLLGSWLVVVVVIPATVSAVVSAVYPSPSRVALTTALRAASDEAAAQGDTAVNQFLADHPEMLQTGVLAASNAWGRTLAQQERANDAMRPVYAAFDSALAAQHRAAALTSMASPAVMAQELLHDLADRSIMRFRRFDAAIDTHHQAWQQFFFQRVFGERPVRRVELATLPSFVYADRSTGEVLRAQSGTLIALLLPALFFSWLGWRRLARVAVHD
jgi:ABC-2 type transport system permease protein